MIQQLMRLKAFDVASNAIRQHFDDSPTHLNLLKAKCAIALMQLRCS
jgi:hypothetical protein